MKATRKLIPALALLLVSAVLLSTASYAWFTTNTVVTADMTVGVTTPQNLQISTDQTNWTQAITYTGTTNLSPVSSKDGQEFVQWTVGDGDISLNGVINGTDVTISGNAVLSGTDAAGTLAAIDDPKAATGLVDYKLMYLRSTISTAIQVDVAFDLANAGLIGNSARVAVVLSDGTNTEVHVFAPEKAATETAIGVDGSSFEVVEVTDDLNTDAVAYTTVTTAPGTSLQVEVYIWYEGNDPACVAESVITGNDLGITVSFNATTTE